MLDVIMSIHYAIRHAFLNFDQMSHDRKQMSYIFCRCTASVTVRATKSDVKFRGLLIQARRYNNTLDQDEPIGYFTAKAGYKVSCAGNHGVCKGSSQNIDVQQFTKLTSLGRERLATASFTSRHQCVFLQNFV